MNAEKYDWTIMLYLSGDNSLSQDMIRALNDIAAQGVPPKVAITIQYDPSAANRPTFVYALAAGPPGPESEEETAELAARVKGTIGPFPIPQHLKRVITDEDSADPRTLADFIRRSTRAYPSTYRMLILSGHGSGAVGDFLTDQNARNGQPNSLTIPQLRSALRLAETGAGAGRHCGEAFKDAELASAGEPHLLHVLGMDSCLMGMAEVCHEVRGYVAYLVGSEGFVPNAGWPYAHLLQRLRQHCKDERLKTPEDMAKLIVDDVSSYYESHLPAGVSIDIAGCELKKLPSLTLALGKLAATLQGDLSDPVVRDLVVTAHWRAQSYKLEQHTDLKDFCDQLAEGALFVNRLKPIDASRRRSLTKIVKQCNEVGNAIGDVVGGRQEFCGPEFQYSHGLSVYFPWSASDPESLEDYSRLAFASDEASGWSAFLTRYLKATKRDPRCDDDHPADGHASVSSDSAPIVGTQPVAHRFAEGNNRFAEGNNRFAEGNNRFAEGNNRFSEGNNRFAEGNNRFLMMTLNSATGSTLPWSMKNPPTSVRIRSSSGEARLESQPLRRSARKAKRSTKKKLARTRKR
jgi:hypothetical protein